MKRGQITIFAIIGIILILSVLLFVFLRPKANPDIEVKDPTNVRQFIESCLTQSANQALFYQGYIGGDVSLYSDFYIYDSFYRIPYVYYEGGNKFLDADKIEVMLEQSVEKNFPICIDNFNSIKDAEVTDKPAKADVKITRHGVIFELNYIAKVFQNEATTTIGPDFSKEIDVNLLDMISISEIITEKALLDDSIIDWEYISTKNEKYNMTAFKAPDNNIIYRIIDTKDIFARLFTYQFAVKAR